MLKEPTQPHPLRNTIKKFKLAIIFGLGAGCLSTGCMRIIQICSPSHVPVALTTLKVLCAFEWLLIPQAFFPSFVKHVLLLSFVLGFYGGAMRYWLWEVLFPPLDREILIPVPPPFAFDPLRGEI